MSNWCYVPKDGIKTTTGVIFDARLILQQYVSEGIADSLASTVLMCEIAKSFKNAGYMLSSEGMVLINNSSGCSNLAHNRQNPYYDREFSAMYLDLQKRLCKAEHTIFEKIEQLGSGCFKIHITAVHYNS